MNLYIRINILALASVLMFPSCLGFSLMIPALTSNHVASRISTATTATTVMKATSKELSNDSSESTYHKGGNAHYLHPIIMPTLLDDDEECEEWVIDFATGDELCWNESPKSTTQNYQMTVPKTTVFQQHNKNPKNVDEDLHKGGNARYEQAANVHALVEDCDSEHRYIDFATGDELCWT